MLVPNRHKATDGYRYGFQGQEKDDEIRGGEGNSLNYTFRMHDPRIGRFFAVDPLTSKYPHYTPYSFSGNKVIAHRELEGKEDLSIHVLNPITPNGIGRAQLTITMEHQIITQGVGELYNRSLINPSDYTAAYDRGDVTLFSTNLPSPTTAANFLSDRGGLFRSSDSKLASKAYTASNPAEKLKYMTKLAERGITSFYAIDVDYNYTLTMAPNTTVVSAATWVSTDVRARGIIFNPDNTMTTTIGSANYNQHTGVYNGLFTANRFGLQLKSTEGAAGLSEGITGHDPSTNYNFVAGNPSLFSSGSKYNFSLNATKVMVHEVGHNNAAVNIHNTTRYEYDQRGTQSNTDPAPTPTNTKNLINDQTNRTTL